MNGLSNKCHWLVLRSLNERIPQCGQRLGQLEQGAEVAKHDRFEARALLPGGRGSVIEAIESAGQRCIGVKY